MAKNSTLVDVDLVFHFAACEYYCVSVEEDGFQEADRIFLNREYVEKDGTTFTMPEWYATEKGLV